MRKLKVAVQIGGPGAFWKLAEVDTLETVRRLRKKIGKRIVYILDDLSLYKGRM